MDPSKPDSEQPTVIDAAKARQGRGKKSLPVLWILIISTTLAVLALFVTYVVMAT